MLVLKLAILSQKLKHSNCKSNMILSIPSATFLKWNRRILLSAAKKIAWTIAIIYSFRMRFCGSRCKVCAILQIENKVLAINEVASIYKNATLKG